MRASKDFWARRWRVLFSGYAAGVALAQDAFPSRTVRIVIPYPAGGGTDTIGRLVADQLSRKWGQPVVVENLGGAAGNVGAAQVFRAAPDGHTMMIASPGPIATNSFLYKDMPFDPARWTSIALLATGPYVLVDAQEFRRRDGQGPDRASQGCARQDHRGDAGGRLGRAPRDGAA